MSVFRQDDGRGHGITYLDNDGYITCTFGKPEETANRVREMVNFNCRPDDVFICAPVKSGTHWTWEMISMMYTQKAETIPKSKIEHMIEASQWEEIENLTSPRILNTHLHYNRLPKQVKEKGCKIVYVLRNPKDVSVSLYNHTVGIEPYGYKGKWEHFLPLFVHGKTEYNSWFEYVLEWEDIMASNPELPVHLIYYEDLKENTLQEVHRLGKFLGVENKDGLFEAISEKCQFDNMVKDKKQYLAPNGAFLGAGFTFYRKGDIGDWKNWFTVAQNEIFDEIYSNKMKDSKHKFRYSRKVKN
ncbi:sulfotransferase 1B1-like [Mercenaria mercenaria]|uniref:sulfotransferase 1B1-like n=1 Tax=Mercenaria mercenaria TaxID=6596 RepID=UPI00234E5363|nr:sulfotransferase 1B1-like [Mercenaria mercenaria]